MPKVGGGVFERIKTDGRTRYKPISGARVVFLEVGNPTNIAWTDTAANGRYSVDLPSAGDYDRVAAAQGYTTHSTVGRAGHSAIGTGPRPHVSNFFLEPDTSTPDVILQKHATLQAVIELPEQGDGKLISKRDIETSITFNVSKGTMDLADIPNFHNDDGMAFEAALSSEDGVYTKANQHAQLTVDGVLDPDAWILGKDIYLHDVALSTQTTIGFFEGKPLNRATKRMILVGKTRTEQAGRRPIYDNKPMNLKLLIDLDDVDGLF